MDYALLALGIMNLGAVAYVIYSTAGLRKWIGSLHSDAQRVTVTPHMIETWKKKISTLDPNSHKYRAYKASLKSAGVEWP